MGSRIFLVDVEASGPSTYSGLMTEFGVVDLESGHWFRGQIWDCVPNPDLPAQPLPVKKNLQYSVGHGAHDLDAGFTRSASTLKEIADAHSQWLQKLAGGDRITFASDNPGYDWQWVSHFFDEAGIPNPYGWSSRRIGDFYAGLTQKFGNTSRWKSLRETKHTHESHADSMGNREALLKLRAASEELHRRHPELASELRDILKAL